MERLTAFLKTKTKLDCLSGAIAVLQSAAMYLYFSYLTYTGNISIAEYSVLLGAVTLLTSILIGFFDNMATINKLISYMAVFTEYKQWITDHSKIYATNQTCPAKNSCDGFRLEFDRVSFTYPGTDTPVLTEVSFTIENGQKVGLVGLNGSGKTTIVKLILRLYTPTSGRILLNGMDISRMNLDDYLKKIGVVLQDYCIFAYSIMENIAFDRAEGMEDEIREAIEKSGLGEKVDSLKDGYRTVLFKELDENGIEFSGGEGQKLAMARALFRQSVMLILDEPTSALDPIAEHEFFESMRDMAEDKTTLFISHRLSSTKFCDSILVLQGGRIVEEGPHTFLLNKGGLYCALFETQARYYREKSEEP